MRVARGFSLIETIVSFAIVAVFAAGAVIFLSGGEQRGSDIYTHADLGAVLDAASTYRDIHGSLPYHPSALHATAGAPTAVTTGDSTDLYVSVLLDPAADTIRTAKLTFDLSCWFAYRDFSAAPGAPTDLYAVASTGATTTCNAASWEPAVDGDRGEQWDRPVVLP